MILLADVCNIIRPIYTLALETHASIIGTILSIIFHSLHITTIFIYYGMYEYPL